MSGKVKEKIPLYIYRVYKEELLDRSTATDPHRDSANTKQSMKSITHTGTLKHTKTTRRADAIVSSIRFVEHVKI